MKIGPYTLRKPWVKYVNLELDIEEQMSRAIMNSIRSDIVADIISLDLCDIDCDVIQADGGTRTAAITGAWVALRIACERLLLAGAITQSPLTGQVAAISCGIQQGQAVLDLDYDEDSNCDTDMNIVMTEQGKFVEIQGTAEGEPFTKDEMNNIIQFAEQGIAELIQIQKNVLK